MKAPLARNAPVAQQRMSSWLADFTGYRHNVNVETIRLWLDQFAAKDRDLGARVLDCVDFVTHERVAAAFRNILNSLPGWNVNPIHRIGRWAFVAFSGTPGESGDSMLHKFRNANGLGRRQFGDLFLYKRDLPGAGFGPEDNIVFVDDFSGTGNQAVNAWEEQLEELLPEHPNIYLVLVAASAAARQRIAESTRMVVNPYFELTEADNIFSENCPHFTEEEKQVLYRYCRRADTRHPKGYGDCGFVLVFAHNCPNNSIPVLHATTPKWHALFRRND